MRRATKAVAAVGLTLVLSVAFLAALGSVGGAATPSNWQSVERYQPVTNATVAYYASLNANNSAVFASDVTAACGANSTSSSTGRGGVFVVGLGCITNVESDVHPEHTAANVFLLQEGFNASCLVDCHGVTYTLDPTITITNEGHDFIQGKLYGATQSITLVATDYADVIGISTSTASIAVTDNWASAGPCDSSNIYNTGSSGAQPTAATVTAGTPASGSVTTTLAVTFSITTAISSAQASCITTEAPSGSHPYLFGEVGFGPDSFVSGDSLTVTDTMTSS